MDNLFANFSEQIAVAAVLVTTTGIMGYAVMQLIKQCLDAISKGKIVIPANIMSTVSGLIAVGLSAFAMAAQGTHWLVAMLACIVALYVPSVTHDAVSNVAAVRLKAAKKKK